MGNSPQNKVYGFTSDNEAQTELTRIMSSSCSTFNESSLPLKIPKLGRNTHNFNTMKIIKTIIALFIGLTIFSCNNQENPTIVKSNLSLNEQEKTVVEVTEPTEIYNGKIQGIYGGCGYNLTPEQATITLYQPRPRELSQINSNFEIFRFILKF